MGGRTTNKPGWSTERLSDMLGVTPRQLRYWVQIGLVSASLSPPKGRGHRLRFDLRDYLVVSVVKELMFRGLSLYKIRRSVERIKRLWSLNNPLAELRVGCVTQSVVFKRDGSYIDGFTGQEVFEFIIDRMLVTNTKKDYLDSKKEVENALKCIRNKLAAM